MDMASPEELGLVWMGDMLLHSDPGSLMLTSNVDGRHAFFNEPSQPTEDLAHHTPMYVQDMNGMNSIMFLDDMEDTSSGYYPPREEKCQMATSEATVDTPVHQAASSFMNNAPKKLRLVKHPGLKLQTPIAYQRDTDINVIPIQKDGMAVCEKCGAIGVKHAFYTRERRFCSLACARGSTESLTSGEFPVEQQKHKNTSDESGGGGGAWSGGMVPSPLPDEPPFPPDPRGLPHLATSYDWADLLADPNFQAAPVSNFVHAPMADCWDNMTVGMKVEVENTDCDNYNVGVPDSFWVATVLHIAGYKALLRYEGFGQNQSKDFWVNLCSSKVHPVGWCATRGKPLIPPKTIEDKYKDWKHFLVKRLTGARTLPSNFYSKVHENLKSRFRCDLNLEVVDKNRISQVKVATIKKIVGKRLHVKYYDADSSDNGFWAHEDSPLVHPVGWAKRVGQTLASPPVYADRCLKGLRDKDDATEDLFPLSNSLAYHTGFRAGMKLEAVDPLNLGSICVATIMKVLNEGYLMIRIESYDDDASSPGADWFCYHSTSACILPPGFCEIHQLRLVPPKDCQHFSWSEYLAETNSHPAPAELFELEPPEHNFQISQKLEAADLMDPRLVCVATVSHIVGRLIKVHFDGWESDYDQWLDLQSCDMYPVGWSELVSHKLEGPPPANKLLNSKRGVETRGPRRRKGRRVGRRGAGRRAGSDQAIQDGADSSTGQDEPMDSAQLPSPPLDPPTVTPNSQPTQPSGELVDRSREMTSELGAEPSGPDQSLPDSLPPPVTISQPCVLEVTKPVEEVIKVIPVMTNIGSDLSSITPLEWTEQDVAQFLSVNNCAAYSQSFTQEKIVGSMLLTLTKDEIIALTGKVGPSLKIYDLIQQLKVKVNPAQERMKAGLKRIL